MAFNMVALRLWSSSLRDLDRPVAHACHDIDCPAEGLPLPFAGLVGPAGVLAQEREPVRYVGPVTDAMDRVAPEQQFTCPVRIVRIGLDRAAVAVGPADPAPAPARIGGQPRFE